MAAAARAFVSAAMLMWTSTGVGERRPEDACAWDANSVSCRWALTVRREAERHGAPIWRTGSGLRRIALIYYGPPSLASGDIGLERAVELLESTTRRKVWWMNTAEIEGATLPRPGELCQFLRVHFDHLLVKSNWDYVVDRFVRDYVWSADGSGCELTRSLQIAGSYPPPAGPASMRFYDTVYYETPWYAATFTLPARAFHAFGVDVDDLRDKCRLARTRTKAPEWDWLFVGAFADHAGYKRPERLALRDGRRLAVGKLRDNAGQDNISAAAVPIVSALESAGVVVRGPVSWSQLGELLVTTRRVLIPDDWRGGGERAVLEARSCGVQIALEPDNPKLLNLSQGPLYSTLYYAGQLERGLISLENDIRIAAEDAAWRRDVGGETRAETCGMAHIRFPADPQRWCWKSPDYSIRVDLRVDLPRRRRSSHQPEAAGGAGCDAL